MSAAELLKHAQAKGVLLALVQGRLTWEADHQPPADLLAELVAHKAEIIEALNGVNDPPAEAMEWLAGVARLLECLADYLLGNGFVDRFDLAEQHRQPPRLAARLIRSHPQWPAPAQLREQFARVREEAREPYEPQSADGGISPNWIAARNAYHAHAFGACPRCYPPLKRYCLIGAELRARYDHETHIQEAHDGKSRA